MPVAMIAIYLRDDEYAKYAHEKKENNRKVRDFLKKELKIER